MSTESQASASSSIEEVFVILQEGEVREIVGEIPPNIQITIIDLDIEDIDPQCLQISPLDGEACLITKF